jgi:hypothetical protein
MASPAPGRQDYSNSVIDKKITSHVPAVSGPTSDVGYGIRDGNEEPM